MTRPDELPVPSVRRRIAPTCIALLALGGAAEACGRDDAPAPPVAPAGAGGESLASGGGSQGGSGGGTAGSSAHGGMGGEGSEAGGSGGLSATWEGTRPVLSRFAAGATWPRRADAADPREYGDCTDEMVTFYADPAAQYLVWLEDSQAYQDLQAQSAGAVVQATLDELVDAAYPMWSAHRADIAADVRVALDAPVWAGTLELKRAPDATGDLGAGHEHRYPQVAHPWRLPCLTGESTPPCAFPVVDLSDVSTTLTVEGSFGAQVAGDDLGVALHALSLPLGQVGWWLANQRVSSLLLGEPGLFGDLASSTYTKGVIQTWNDGAAASEVVTAAGCVGAGEALAKIIDGGSSFVEAVAEQMCTELEVAIADWTAQCGQLAAAVDGADNLSLSATACTATLGETPVAFGDPTAPCAWAGDVTWGSETAQPISGAFAACPGCDAAHAATLGEP